MIDYESALILDTETTGLSEDDQIIEIAAVDWYGTPVIDYRIKPSVAIDPDAHAVHGISLEDLKDCPSWPEVESEIKALLFGQPVIIFNADFDMRMIVQTSEAYDKNSS